MKKQTKKLLMLLMVCSMSAVTVFASGCGFTKKLKQLRCEHVWDEGEVTIEATCTENGEKTFTCTECEDTKTEEIAALGHVAEVIPEVPATCEKDGTTESKYCKKCEEVLVAPEIIVALGHTETVIPGVAATCTGNGATESKVCAICEEVLMAPELIPPLGHTWIDADYDKPKTCSICGETEGEPLQFTWSDGDGMYFMTEKKYEFAKPLMSDGEYVFPKTISICFRLNEMPTSAEYLFGNYKADTAGYPYFNLSIKPEGYFSFWYKNCYFENCDEKCELVVGSPLASTFNDDKAKVLADGQYHTYTFVFNCDGRIYLYIDGSYTGVSRTDVFVSIPATTKPFAVGSNYTDDGTFTSGAIKYLLMYKDIRTDAEIWRDYIGAVNTDPDLLVYLDLTGKQGATEIENQADADNSLNLVE